MSISTAIVDELASLLWDAHRTGGRAPEPTVTVPGFTVQDGYAVQRRLVDLHLSAGERAIGWKIGMASATAPAVAKPIYGRLLSGMAVPNGGELASERLHEPFAEGEIAFQLAEDLSGSCIGTDEVLAATRGIQPAIEIFARRLGPAASKTADIVADNSLSTAFALGEMAVSISGWDLSLLGMVLRRNGKVVGTGAGAQVLEHPARAVAWLAGALASRGDQLRAGDVVLTGALAGAHSGKPGDHFTATGDRIGEVAVTFR